MYSFSNDFSVFPPCLLWKPQIFNRVQLPTSWTATHALTDVCVMMMMMMPAGIFFPRSSTRMRGAKKKKMMNIVQQTRDTVQRFVSGSHKWPSSAKVEHLSWWHNEYGLLGAIWSIRMIARPVGDSRWLLAGGDLALLDLLGYSINMLNMGSFCRFCVDKSWDIRYWLGVTHWEWFLIL